MNDERSDEAPAYEGLRVVDLSQGIAGPHCGMLFALNGAEVFKVEPPEGEVLEMPSIFIGSVDQIVNEMQGRRERYGSSYYVVPDSSLELVAPIVGRLAGV